jgi:hypothetical protein
MHGMQQMGRCKMQQRMQSNKELKGMQTQKLSLISVAVLCHHTKHQGLLTTSGTEYSSCAQLT